MRESDENARKCTYNNTAYFSVHSYELCDLLRIIKIKQTVSCECFCVSTLQKKFFTKSENKMLHKTITTEVAMYYTKLL